MLYGHTTAVVAMGVAPGEWSPVALVSISRNGSVRVWNVTDGRYMMIINVHDDNAGHDNYIDISCSFWLVFPTFHS